MEVGSLADWVAAVGGVLSIGATGYIALNERGRANRLEDSTSDLEQIRRHQVIDEGERLAGRATQRLNKFALLANLGGARTSTVTGDLWEELAAFERQIALLQQFHFNTPRIFVALGQLSEACRPMEEVRARGANYGQVHAEIQRDKIAAALEELTALR